MFIYCDCPCLHAEMIGDFLQNVFWSDRDFLIIDTPPGTSDEHISVIQNLRSYNPDGAVLVTTPQVGCQNQDLVYWPVVGNVHYTTHLTTLAEGFRENSVSAQSADLPRLHNTAPSYH